MHKGKLLFENSPFAQVPDDFAFCLYKLSLLYGGWECVSSKILKAKLKIQTCGYFKYLKTVFRETHVTLPYTSGFAHTHVS